MSTLEAFQVDLELENDGPSAATIPGPQDLTHALTLELRRRDGTPVVAMSGLTRQALMNRGRIDATPLLETLEPGGRWTWSLDLARYHLPPEAGLYDLVAVYRHEESGTAVRSDPRPVEVEAVRLSGVSLLEDAPVLDGLTLLLRATSSAGEMAVLRQHNAPRPLAAWYSEVIDGARAGQAALPGVAWDGPVAPFLAAARYRTSESFDPTFLKWLISSDGAEIRAHCFEWGHTDPQAGTAPAPAGLELLNSASYDVDNRLLLVFRRPEGTIEVHEMQSQRLEKRFELALPRTSLAPIVRWDCDEIHVITPDAGVLYHRLNHDGDVQQELRLQATACPLVGCDLDPFRRLVRVTGLDPVGGARGGPLIELAVIGSDPQQVELMRFDNPLPGTRLTELSFDRDAAGRFYLLFATTDKSLHYLGPEGPPCLVAEGEARWWPLVRAARGLQLGYFHTPSGYRFRAWRGGQPAPLPGTPGGE